MSGEKEKEGEKGFRIVDKPGGAAKEEPAGPEEQAQQAGAAAQQPLTGEEGERVEAVDVYGVLRYCIALLHSQAWQNMGLVTNPATQRVERDMEQARVAIDCIGFMAEKLQPKASEEERRSLRNLLTDLRLNFARQQEQPQG